MLASSSRVTSKQTCISSLRRTDPDLTRFLRTSQSLCLKSSNTSTNLLVECVRRSYATQQATENAVSRRNSFSNELSFSRRRNEGGGLSHRPWSFSQDTSFQGTTARTHLVHFNVALDRACRKKDAILALKVCQDMRDAGVKPDITTYNHLLEVLGEEALGPEAHAIFDDMLETGIRPDSTSFHHLIYVCLCLGMSRAPSQLFCLGPPTA